MIIQQQAARKAKQESQEIQQATQDDQTVRKRHESEAKIIIRKLKGRVRNRVEPVSLAPRTIEEAPLRRMDR